VKIRKLKYSHQEAHENASLKAYFSLEGLIILGKWVQTDSGHVRISAFLSFVVFRPKDSNIEENFL